MEQKLHNASNRFYLKKNMLHAVTFCYKGLLRRGNFTPLPKLGLQPFSVCLFFRSPPCANCLFDAPVIQRPIFIRFALGIAALLLLASNGFARQSKAPKEIKEA